MNRLIKDVLTVTVTQETGTWKKNHVSATVGLQWPENDSLREQSV